MSYLTDSVLYTGYMKQIIKSTLLLGALTSLFLFIGYMVGGRQGMYIALGFSALTNIGAYWFSDKLVLSMQGAKRADPSLHKDLIATVQELASVDGLPMPAVYVVDSPVPNAFATGRSPKHAAVAATTGILALLDHSELRGVLAHELGHVKNRDILVSSIAATAAGAISMIAQMAFFMGGSSDREDRGSNPLALIAMLLLAPLAATLIQLAISRSREYLADEYGARVIGDGDPLARALAKLRDFKSQHKISASPQQEATAHLMFANMFNGGALAGLFSTHPDMNDRIERLNKL
jgi:heat shock protein HtpX